MLVRTARFSVALDGADSSQGASAHWYAQNPAVESPELISTKGALFSALCFSLNIFFPFRVFLIDVGSLPTDNALC